MTRDDVWIAMDDGVRLAATLYRPPGDPAPCLLEALPYRKDDVTASYTPEYGRFRDEFGYAVCRLDLRGTGSSEGIATDEYPEREQDGSSPGCCAGPRSRPTAPTGGTARCDPTTARSPRRP